MSERRLRTISVLLILTALVFGVIPPVVDISETHVFKPDWPPHARFHMVWLLGVTSTLAVMVIALVLARGEGREQRLRFASLLGVAAFSGFVIATLTQSAYGGALIDPTGGEPLILGTAPQLVTFTPFIVMQLIAVWLAFSRRGAA